MVEREDPRDLRAHRLELTAALHLTLDRPVGALTQQDARMAREAVDGEREPHRPVPRWRAERPAEPEARRALEREGTARDDRSGSRHQESTSDAVRICRRSASCCECRRRRARRAGHHQRIVTVCSSAAVRGAPLDGDARPEPWRQHEVKDLLRHGDADRGRAGMRARAHDDVVGRGGHEPGDGESAAGRARARWPMLPVPSRDRGVAVRPARAREAAVGTQLGEDQALAAEVGAVRALLFVEQSARATATTFGSRAGRAALQLGALDRDAVRVTAQAGPRPAVSSSMKRVPSVACSSRAPPDSTCFIPVMRPLRRANPRSYAVAARRSAGNARRAASLAGSVVTSAGRRSGLWGGRPARPACRG